jgi:hypothetical protein
MLREVRRKLLLSKRIVRPAWLARKLLFKLLQF